MATEKTIVLTLQVNAGGFLRALKRAHRAVARHASRIENKPARMSAMKTEYHRRAQGRRRDPS